MSEPSVIIVGGGLAGLAAAVGLGGQGVPVTLLESRDRLGGRASSFVDQSTGEVVDNCQHVSMGCCTNLARFCETVGVADQFETAAELTFVGPDGEVGKLRASSLPAPLHLLPSLAGLPYLSLRQKLQLASGVRALARCSPDDMRRNASFLDWLQANRQSPELIERFWEVVLVSALGETLDRIDIGHARKVFVDGFLRHRAGWEVRIPRLPLDQLFGQPVIDWLAEQGGEVRLRQGVKTLTGAAGRVTGVVLRDGETLRADEFVVALTQDRLHDVLPDSIASGPAWDELRRRVRSIETSPISSLHFWFDRPIANVPHAVLVGRLSQWLFRRSETPRDAAAPVAAVSPHEPAHCYQVVISASRGLIGRPREEVRDEVLAELRAVFPQARDAALLHWRLVTEHKAVFSVTPGIETLRPAQQSPTPNLQLAGDWTDTGWPATMESAIRSGFLAAQNILHRRGKEVTLLQPDLPTSGLARSLFGLSTSQGQS
ncbi:MAG: hydroxysqualene dehydroxylase HpnE [Planctomycetaceae bacterium]